ncbi:MAG: HRDC domain-containing protein [Candidatus Omnitrophica bacterium]|nr:HRDC domain-containing protein [Candidatus Omnitrophota bacterium]
MSFQLIDSAEKLHKAVAAVNASSWAAVDTEADSLHHYLEKLCLLQVSVASQDFVIDPLAGFDLRPIVEALAAKPLLLHGADFDIRILNRFYGFVPREIFDTMLAAQILGYPKQGLADLALQHCEVSLSKKSQKADWSKRPLEQTLLEYAAGDTHYLKTIRDIMEKELREKGRLEWHRQNCAKLIQSITQKTPDERPKESWRVKGSNILRGKTLALFKALWEWREGEAKRRDRPSFKVLHNETLLDIAKWAEKHPNADAADMDGAPRNVRGEYREALNRILRQTGSLPVPEAFSHKPGPRKKWGDDEEKLMGQLKTERLTLSNELQIHPSLLATNAELEAIILTKPTDKASLASAGLLPWQIDTFGDRILKILQ